MKQKLSTMINTEIVVVMSDGNCYKGKLAEFDKEIIVLHDITETTTKDIAWETSLKEKIQKKGGVERGYIAWRHIALPEVIIRIDRVLRVWPWKPKIVGKKKRFAKDEPLAIYSRAMVRM
jgi:small nuclear ribonucleoprotein (snRNP)-like protein